MDEDGYLTITGRLKEIINRGGEKISPREVDDVLMDHPAVQQVVTFAMPHDKLGEEVAAAIVLREGVKSTEREIQAFAPNTLPISSCLARYCSLTRFQRVRLAKYNGSASLKS